MVEELVRKSEERMKQSGPSRLIHKTEDKAEIEDLSKHFSQVIERLGVRTLLVPYIYPLT